MLRVQEAHAATQARSWEVEVRARENWKQLGDSPPGTFLKVFEPSELPRACDRYVISTHSARQAWTGLTMSISPVEAVGRGANNMR